MKNSLSFGERNDTVERGRSETECRWCKPPDMFPYIRGPLGSETRKSARITGKECPQGFLVPRRVAGHRSHKAINSFSRSPHCLLANALPSSLVD